MDRENNSERGWIAPLLGRLNLLQNREKTTDMDQFRAQVEECRLAEVIGKIAGEINHSAGYHVVDYQDFLPPQKIVARAVFAKNGTRNFLDILLREDGVLLLFYTLKRSSTRRDRYFPWYTRRKGATIHVKEIIDPEGISEEDVRKWFTYLLSGLDKKLKPNAEGETGAVAPAPAKLLARKASM